MKVNTFYSLKTQNFPEMRKQFVMKKLASRTLASVPKSTILISLICAIGLTYQIIDVCERYFTYGTVSRIIMQLPLNIDMPGASVCFRIEKILNRDDIFKNRKIRVPEAKKNWTAYYLEMNKLSVAEIFEYTPQTKNVLSKTTTGCMVRYPGNFAINYPYAMGSDCYRILLIQKYMQRQFMCYKFSVQMEKIIDKEFNMASKDRNKNMVPDKRRKNASTLLIDESSLTPNLPGLIYNIWLDNALFGEVTLYSSFAHGHDTCPLFDSIFASSYDNSHSSNTTMPDFHITPRSVTISRLPRPYDTECTDYAPFRSRYEKILSSVRKESEQSLKLIPTFSHVYERHKYPYLSPYHVRNSTIAAQLKGIINSFHIEDPECFIKYFVTDMKTILSTNVKVSLIWPQDVSLSIDYQADKVLIDLVIYISSCVGLWFGITLIHCFQGTLKLLKAIINHPRREQQQYIKDGAAIAGSERYQEGANLSENHSGIRRKQSISARSLQIKESSDLNKLVEKSVVNYSALLHQRTLRSVDWVLSRFEDRINDKIHNASKSYKH